MSLRRGDTAGSQSVVLSAGGVNISWWGVTRGSSRLRINHSPWEGAGQCQSPPGTGWLSQEPAVTTSMGSHCQTPALGVRSVSCAVGLGSAGSMSLQRGVDGSATRSALNQLSFVPQPTLHQARPLRTVPSWD